MSARTEIAARFDERVANGFGPQWDKDVNAVPVYTVDGVNPDNSLRTTRYTPFIHGNRASHKAQQGGIRRLGLAGAFLVGLLWRNRGLPVPADLIPTRDGILDEIDAEAAQIRVDFPGPTD